MSLYNYFKMTFFQTLGKCFNRIIELINKSIGSGLVWTRAVRFYDLDMGLVWGLGNYVSGHDVPFFSTGISDQFSILASQ